MYCFGCVATLLNELRSRIQRNQLSFIISASEGHERGVTSCAYPDNMIEF